MGAIWAASRPTIWGKVEGGGEYNFTKSAEFRAGSGWK